MVKWLIKHGCIGSGIMVSPKRLIWYPQTHQNTPFFHRNHFTKTWHLKLPRTKGIVKWSSGYMGPRGLVPRLGCWRPPQSWFCAPEPAKIHPFKEMTLQQYSINPPPHGRKGGLQGVPTTPRMIQTPLGLGQYGSFLGITPQSGRCSIAPTKYGWFVRLCIRTSVQSVYACVCASSPFYPDIYSPPLPDDGWTDGQTHKSSICGGGNRPLSPWGADAPSLLHYLHSSTEMRHRLLKITDAGASFSFHSKWPS